MYFCLYEFLSFVKIYSLSSNVAKCWGNLCFEMIQKTGWRFSGCLRQVKFIHLNSIEQQVWICFHRKNVIYFYYYLLFCYLLLLLLFILIFIISFIFIYYYLNVTCIYHYVAKWGKMFTQFR